MAKLSFFLNMGITSLWTSQGQGSSSVLLIAVCSEPRIVPSICLVLSKY